VLPSHCSCAVLSDSNKRFLYDVGVYDDDDNDDDNLQGMGDFIGEMAQMMSQARPTVRTVSTLVLVLDASRRL
jgi:CRP-like cAMP-binding protein